jgi:hypothetical protein
MGMDGSKRPTAAIPHSDLHHAQKTQVELTILIAMPHPPYPTSDRPTSSRNQSFQSVNLDPDIFELGALPHYQHTSERRTDDEEEEIPHLELGTTVVPISLRTEEEETVVQDIRLGTRAARAGIASDWGGVRIGN